MAATVNFLLFASILIVFYAFRMNDAAVGLEKADPAPDNPKNCFYPETQGSIPQGGTVPGPNCSQRTCDLIGDELHWSLSTCGKVSVELPKGCDFIAQNATGDYPDCCPSKLKC